MRCPDILLKKLLPAENANMDWNQINKFIEESGGQAMIIIEGRPALVVMSYDKYRQADHLDQFDPNDQSVQENQDDPVEEPESMVAIAEGETDQPEPSQKELAIDDLPL